MTPNERLTALLGEHRRCWPAISGKPDWCSGCDWVGSDHRAHVAAVLTDAGLVWRDEVEAERDNAIAAWRELSDRLSLAWQVYERMTFDPTANHFDKLTLMNNLADLRATLTITSAEHLGGEDRG